jgi:putative ABC transport system substrate-binding protein
MLAAADTLGLELHVVNASTETDFDAVFAKISQLQASGLVISAGTAIFAGRSGQLAALAARYGVPAVGANRAFAVAGGLMHYGADIVDAYRLTGGYVGRILKGEKPADLPVQQAPKIELLINLKASKALGITVPLTLLGRADEVIE